MNKYLLSGTYITPATGLLKLPTEAQAALKASFQRAIQADLDAAAVTKLYNDGNALAGYVASTTLNG